MRGPQTSPVAANARRAAFYCPKRAIARPFRTPQAGKTQRPGLPQQAADGPRTGTGRRAPAAAAPCASKTPGTPWSGPPRGRSPLQGAGSFCLEARARRPAAGDEGRGPALRVWAPRWPAGAILPAGAKRRGPAQRPDHSPAARSRSFHRPPLRGPAAFPPAPVRNRPIPADRSSSSS